MGGVGVVLKRKGPVRIAAGCNCGRMLIREFLVDNLILWVCKAFLV